METMIQVNYGGGFIIQNNCIRKLSKMELDIIKKKCSIKIWPVDLNWVFFENVLEG